MNFKVVRFVSFMIAIAVSAFAGSQSTVATQSASLRNWTVGLADKIEGWALFKDGEAVCILKKGGAITVQKLIRLSTADKTYLTSNPPPTRKLFDPEEECISLDKEIEFLSGRLATLEATRKSGRYYEGVVDADGESSAYYGSYSEGASKSTIKKISAALADRSAKLTALKLAFKLKTPRPADPVK